MEAHQHWLGWSPLGSLAVGSELLSESGEAGFITGEDHGSAVTHGQTLFPSVFDGVSESLLVYEFALRVRRHSSKVPRQVISWSLSCVCF